MTDKTKEAKYRITRNTHKYDLLVMGDGTRGIRCKRCNLISWHPLDVRYKYCDNCKLFIYSIFEAFGGLKED